MSNDEWNFLQNLKEIKMYRHGDIILKPVSKIPEGGKRSEHKELTIALGEATGHHHTLYEPEVRKNPSIELVELDDGRFLIVREAVELRHQEHSCLQIAPGMYEIGEEQEYDYFEETFKKVID